MRKSLSKNGVELAERFFSDTISLNKLASDIKNLCDEKNRLLITGGTGSFGSAYLERAINLKKFSEIFIFSRDEKKQDDLRRKLNNKKVKFFIGDVRDINAVNQVVKNVDFIFHAAALKQVPSCEFFPIEAVKTNMLGTENILNSAEHNSVKKVVILSTDKAAYPINAMGMSKALMEKVMIAKSRMLDGNHILWNKIWKCYGFQRICYPVIYFSN